MTGERMLSGGQYHQEDAPEQSSDSRPWSWLPVGCLAMVRPRWAGRRLPSS